MNFEDVFLVKKKNECAKLEKKNVYCEKLLSNQNTGCLAQIDKTMKMININIVENKIQ